MENNNIEFKKLSKEKITPKNQNILEVIKNIDNFISKEKISTEDLYNNPFISMSPIKNKNTSAVKNNNFPKTNLPSTITTSQISKNINSIQELSSISSSNEKLIYDSSKKPSLTSLESRNKMEEFKKSYQNLPNEILLKIQEKNLLVPINKKNDEKFKLFQMNKIKNKKLPKFKSVKKYEENTEKKNELNQILQYNQLKKKKLVYSYRKNLYLIIPFTSEITNEEINFPLFIDKDIGINEYWQQKMIESKVDEDAETDDEQTKLATSYCFKEVEEGLNLFTNEGEKIIRNKKFINENIK